MIDRECYQQLAPLGWQEGSVNTMLTEYIEAAMRLAHYEQLEESGEYYGEIPPLRGVWATGQTQEKCQAELRDVLEEWIALRIKLNRPFPKLDSVELAVPA